MTRRTVVHESDWLQITRQGVVSELNDKVMRVKGVKNSKVNKYNIENTSWVVWSPQKKRLG